MSISRGWGANAGSRTIQISTGRTIWALKSKALINRNFPQSPLYPLQFAGTSYSYISSSIGLFLTASSVGSENFPVTGGSSFTQLIRATASGVETLNASGSTSTPRIQLSSTGSETFTASGIDIIRFGLTGSSTGIESLFASGTNSVPVLVSLSITGSETFASSGSVTLRNYVLSSSNYENFPISSSTLLPTLQASSGSSSVNELASGSSSLPSISGSGTASSTTAFLASGSTVVPEMKLQFGLAYSSTVVSGGGGTGLGGTEYVRIIHGGSSARPYRPDEYHLRAKLIEQKQKDCADIFVTAEYLGNSPGLLKESNYQDISGSVVGINFVYTHKTVLFNKK